MLKKIFLTMLVILLFFIGKTYFEITNIPVIGNLENFVKFFDASQQKSAVLEYHSGFMGKGRIYRSPFFPPLRDLREVDYIAESIAESGSKHGKIVYEDTLWKVYWIGLRNGLYGPYRFSEIKEKQEQLSVESIVDRVNTPSVEAKEKISVEARDKKIIIKPHYFINARDKAPFKITAYREGFSIVVLEDNIIEEKYIHVDVPVDYKIEATIDTQSVLPGSYKIIIEQRTLRPPTPYKNDQIIYRGEVVIQ